MTNDNNFQHLPGHDGDPEVSAGKHGCQIGQRTLQAAVELVTIWKQNGKKSRSEIFGEEQAVKLC
jgi:hypothetical protein